MCCDDKHPNYDQTQTRRVDFNSVEWTKLLFSWINIDCK